MPIQFKTLDQSPVFGHDLGDDDVVVLFREPRLLRIYPVPLRLDA